MTRNAYTVLGWIVWQLGSRVAKYQLTKKKAKVGAASAIALVLIGGVVAAKAGSGDD